MALLACKPSPPSATEKVLILGSVQEPDSLDPVLTKRAGAQEIIALLFRDVCRYDPAWSVVPDIATSAPVTIAKTATASTWALSIRPSAVWSDGHPVTARDIVFGYRVSRDKFVGSQIDGVPIDLRVKGERELLLQSTRGTVWIPRLLPILPEHAYPEVPTSTAAAASFRGLDGRVSNGPFVLESWERGRSLKVKRNEMWRGRRPGLDRVEFKFFASEDALEMALRAGAVQAVGEGAGLSVDRALAAAAALAGTHEAHVTESGVWLHLDVRLDDPIGGDPRFRKALDLAIDRAALAKFAYDGNASPAGGLFPSKHPARSSTVSVNLTEARTLLASIGSIPRLRMAIASDSSASERAGAAIVEMLAKVGVNLELQSIPFRVLMEMLERRQQPVLAMYAWRLAPDWDASSILASNGDRNYTGVRDLRLDELFRQAARADEPERIRLLRAVDERFREILPTISLLFRRSLSVAPKNLAGWSPTGTQTPVTWNAEDWRFEGTARDLER